MTGAVRITLCIFVLILTAACADEPRLRADTEGNFAKSFQAMSNGLSDAERTKLDNSLRDIVLVKLNAYGNMLNAKKPSSSFLGPQAPATASIAFDTAFKNQLDFSLKSLWPQSRARAVVENVSATVEGKTAKEISLIAEAERRSSDEMALKIFSEQLVKARADLKDLVSGNQEAEKKQMEENALLRLVEITKTRFAYEKSDFTNKPSIIFTIDNKGTRSLKRIFLSGSVQTPGRTVPWVEEDLNYQFPGGLEPGESKQLNLAPNLFSSWSSVPREAAKGAILTLKLIAFEDATGRRVGKTEAVANETFTRQKALEEGVRLLEIQIETLNRSLKE